MSDVSPTSLVPEATLERLAPPCEGTWVVTEQTDDHFTLAYVMDEGTPAVTYHIHPCSTEKDVVEKCGNLMYTYTGHFIGNAIRRGEDGHEVMHLALRNPQDNTQEPEPDEDLTSDSQSENNLPIEEMDYSIAQAMYAYQFPQPTANTQNQQSSIFGDGNGNLNWTIPNDTPAIGDNNFGFNTFGEQPTVPESSFDASPSAPGDAMLENTSNAEWNTYHQY